MKSTIVAKTYMAKESDLAKREWVLVDATDQTLGRLATRIARIILGKHKPNYTPHMDQGDFVVVINAAKIRVTGNKANQIEYPYYTGFRGGLKKNTFREVMAKDPAFPITKAVERMLPKNKLGRSLAAKIKAYAGADHPHGAQAPKPIDTSKI